MSSWMWWCQSFKLGWRYPPDTYLFLSPGVGVNPPWGVWLTFNSSADVWNVLCFENSTSNGAHHGWTVFSSGLKFPNWSRQEMISVSLSLSGEPRWLWRLETLFCLLWCGGKKSSPNKYSRSLLSLVSCLLALWCSIPLSVSFCFYEMEVLILTYLIYEI